MKSLKKLLIFFILIVNLSVVQGQVYEKLAVFATSSTPIYGVKIKTNIPFVSGADMSTIFIRGFSYGGSNPINLQLIFYIYNSGGNAIFFSPQISSSGNYTPKILLSNENGKVVIYIDDKVYFQRFWVDAFSTANAGYYQGWSTADEALSGSSTVEVPYKNSFKGKVEINGNLRAKEIKVETANWPDYVFENGYERMPLIQLEKFIITHKHLPEMPKASEIESEGQSIGEINKILVKKIEELTLYILEQDKRINALEDKNQIK